MFRYTAKKEILRQLETSECNNPYEVKFIKTQQLLKQFGITEYGSQIQFSEHYDTFIYVSKQPKKQIPFNGYLFPVELFTEEQF